MAKNPRRGQSPFRVVVPHIIIIFEIYSCLLVIRWQSSGESISQQQIKAIYLSTLQMMFTLLLLLLLFSYIGDG